MRLYLGFYVCDDSAAPVWLRCVCCDDIVLFILGFHAVAMFDTDWERVARHDRLAEIFLKWLPTPAGFIFQRKYVRGESESLLYGTSYRPTDSFIFPPPAVPFKDPGRPTAIDFLVTGSFIITNDEGRRTSRKSASSSDANTIAGEKAKARYYRLKVHAALKRAFPGVSCPGSETDAPLPPGGLDEVTGV